MTNRTTIFLNQGALFMGSVTSKSDGYEVKIPVQVNFAKNEDGTARADINSFIPQSMFENPSEQVWIYDKSAVTILGSDNVTKGLKELYDKFTTALKDIEGSEESKIIGA